MIQSFNENQQSAPNWWSQFQANGAILRRQRPIIALGKIRTPAQISAEIAEKKRRKELDQMLRQQQDEVEMSMPVYITGNRTGRGIYDLSRGELGRQYQLAIPYYPSIPEVKREYRPIGRDKGYKYQTMLPPVNLPPASPIDRYMRPF